MMISSSSNRLRSSSSCFRRIVQFQQQQQQQQKQSWMTKTTTTKSTMSSVAVSSPNVIAGTFDVEDTTTTTTISSRRWFHNTNHLIQYYTTKVSDNNNNNNRRRLFSSAATAATAEDEGTTTTTTTTTTTNNSSIPTKHSRKLPPPVCNNDRNELQQLTNEILSTPIGQLYTYNSNTTTTTTTATTNIDDNNNNNNDTSDTAWDIAYDTIQKVEYILRGHSSYIPNTLYYDNTNNSDNKKTEEDGDILSSSLEHIEQMQEIIQRIHKEGEIYMELRSERLIQLDREKLILNNNTMNDNEIYDINKLLSNDDDNTNKDEIEEQLQKKKEIYKTSFAPPGPTVTMYDILLDAMATITSNLEDTDSSISTIPWTSNELTDILGIIIKLHDLDGGDLNNTNPNTFPTIVSYNAVLRGISTLPTKRITNDEKYRDDCITNSFGIYNTLYNLNTLHIKLNSSTIYYMLHIINKMFTTSKVKSNIATTFWMHGSQLGLINTNIQSIFQQVAFIPSDTTDTIDDESKETINDFVTTRCNVELNDLPQRFRKNSKKLQHDPSSTIY